MSFAQAEELFEDLVGIAAAAPSQKVNVALAHTDREDCCVVLQDW